MKKRRVFKDKTRTFYKDNIPDALESCLEAGYRPLFIPELADVKIFAKKGDKIFNKGYTTLSSVITGVDRKDKAKVAFVHRYNRLCKPENIRAAINYLEFGDRNHYGAVFPVPEFDDFIDSEDGESILVVDRDKLINSKINCFIPVKKALEHPMVIAFFGGEERARESLEKHREVSGDEISVWYSKNDLVARDTPIGRLLFFGNGSYDLDGDNDLDYEGRFLGVRGSGAAAWLSVRKTYNPQDPKAMKSDFERLKEINKAKSYYPNRKY